MTQEEKDLVEKAIVEKIKEDTLIEYEKMGTVPKYSFKKTFLLFATIILIALIAKAICDTGKTVDSLDGSKVIEVKVNAGQGSEE